jgi:predicted TIM-barrel fold metal-dependent hydrolase
LAKHVEPILEPDLPIIDPHHHLGFEGTNIQYLVPDVLKDMASGHNVIASVFSDCRAHYRTEGPEHLKPVGEIEFVTRLAEEHARAQPNGIKLCAGILGVADLTLGARIEEVLQAQITAGKGRFRGIRGHTHHDPEVLVAGVNWPDRMLYEPRVREAIARLAPLGLAYESWLFHPQIPHLADLARAQPQTTIVLNHCGGPLGVGRWAGREDEVYPVWKKDMQALAHCPNVHVKVGGLGTTTVGFELWDRDTPISSQELARAWSKWIEPTLQMFGPSRCMFESNFPIDKRTMSYAVLWNAFKVLAKGYGREEKAALFSETARRVFRL